MKPELRTSCGNRETTFELHVVRGAPPPPDTLGPVSLRMDREEREARDSNPREGLALSILPFPALRLAGRGQRWAYSDTPR